MALGIESYINEGYICDVKHLKIMPDSVSNDHSAFYDVENMLSDLVKFRSVSIRLFCYSMYMLSLLTDFAARLHESIKHYVPPEINDGYPN